jgi:hypothetical protein
VLPPSLLDAAWLRDIGLFVVTAAIGFAVSLAVESGALRVLVTADWTGARIPGQGAPAASMAAVFERLRCGDLEFRMRVPIVAPGLIGVQTILYLWSVVQAGGFHPQEGPPLFDNLAVWSEGIAGGEWWRLATGFFVHPDPDSFVFAIMITAVLGVFEVVGGTGLFVRAYLFLTIISETNALLALPPEYGWESERDAVIFGTWLGAGLMCIPATRLARLVGIPVLALAGDFLVLRTGGWVDSAVLSGLGDHWVSVAGRSLVVAALVLSYLVGSEWRSKLVRYVWFAALIAIPVVAILVRVSAVPH